MRRGNRARLAVERCEDRLAPAVTAGLSGGVLTVAGDDSGQTVTVKQHAGRVAVFGVAGTFPESAVTRIDVNAGGGDDRIDVTGVTLPTRLTGGGGSDEFVFDFGGSVSLAGDTATDRVRVGPPDRLVKWAKDSRGVVWTLERNGVLRVGGRVHSTNLGNTPGDFALDSRDRLITIDGTGGLIRSREAFGQGEWDILAPASVKKWVLTSLDRVYALQNDGKLLNEGNLAWSNKWDFAIDGRNRIILQDYLFVGGTLVRSREAWGGGGYQTLGTGTTKFVLTSLDRVYSHQNDGRVLNEGSTAWSGKQDFAVDGQR